MVGNATVTGLVLFERMNPVIGTALAIADTFSWTDKLYEGIGTLFGDKKETGKE
jgi:hypothetical protein